MKYLIKENSDTSIFLTRYLADNNIPIIAIVAKGTSGAILMHWVIDIEDHTEREIELSYISLRFNVLISKME